MSIIVVGSLNMDLVVRTPRHPQIGETIIGHNFQTFPGGKGANQAVAAARLGGKVKMVGRVGTDSFGGALKNTLLNDGVDIRFVFSDPDAPSGVALITVDDRGDNSIVVASGANARLSPDHIAAAEEAFMDAEMLLLQLESPLPAIQEAIRLARKHGLRVILNPAPARTLEPELLKSVDYLIPNQSELALLTGLEIVDSAARLLNEIGVPSVIVTLGEDGALVMEKGQETYLPAFQVQAVDTTAAGDAFVGAFAVALTEGHTTMEAAWWGNAAGALATRSPGAQPSLPTRQEFEAFLAEAGHVL